MITIRTEIKEVDDGSVTVHLKVFDIGTTKEMVFTKAILEASRIAAQWLTEQAGGKQVEEGVPTEIIKPVGEDQ